MTAIAPRNAESETAAVPVFNSTFESDLVSASAYFSPVEKRIAQHGAAGRRSADPDHHTAALRLVQLREVLMSEFQI